MTVLDILKSSKTLGDVATLLGYKASALSFILYKKSDASKYTQFDIPKRYGGTRQICAPSPDLKLLQRRLSDRLQDCIAEINKTNEQNDSISHGFKRGRTIITNAQEHRNRKYVFNIDLMNFFSAINFGRVRGFFLKDKNFSLHADVATVLAQIACHENALPQGSPCSPVISNLIGHVLDIHLVRLASRTGCSYSRYADDLTFSTNKQKFPVSIAKRTDDDEHRWIPGNELARLIKKSGFEINPSKTRMQYRDSRQEVTGLIVNRKINVRREYRHKVRAMVHHLFTKGSFEFVHRAVDGNGSVSLSKMEGTMNQLHGMLGFVDGIDLYNKDQSSKNGKDLNDKSSLTSKESMYHRFLLFKDFYAATAPVIVCEGKTDNVYMLHAIKSLAVTYPQLATTSATGSVKLNVRIYKYPNTSTGRILGIHGGASDLSRFMRNYDREIKKFKAPGARQPVILLVDNDAGARGKGNIYSTVEQVSKMKTKITGKEPFIHVTGNLYLVATPLMPGQEQSMIEDFFDESTKSRMVDGKTFNPDKNFDAQVNYGKRIFAQKVVREHADKIDFSGFKAILSNVVSVIDSHAKKQSVVNFTFRVEPAAHPA